MSRLALSSRFLPCTSVVAALIFIIVCCARGTDAQSPYVDPPFDFTRVLFSAVFSGDMVLQRAPQSATIFGTATPGATVSVSLSGPNNFSWISDPSAVMRSSDPSIDGTWKVILPARTAGFGYDVVATCEACPNTTTAAIKDVGFGDVFIASGQSNMECPMLTTLSRFEVYAKTAAGLYDHIRLFQTGTRFLGPRNTSSWILPAVCNPGPNSPCPNNTEQSHSLSPAYRAWILPRSNAGMDDDADTDGFPNRFSAVCWYFGAALSDARADNSTTTPPVPIGLIASSVGGTTIQQWLPPWAAGNATCTENNCGWVEQLDPSRPTQPSTTPACTNASLTNVYNCASGTCSTLWHSMIAPYVNVTIAGAIWYQGEQNQIYGGGNGTSGYLCQQTALIATWRAAFSAVPGTTAPDFPFGVTTLAGGGGEGFPLWSPLLHTTEDVWLDCYIHRLRTPVCNDISDDSMGLIRRAQTGGAGFFSAATKVFMGQAHDLGEPCVCDTRALSPHGCWANGECYGTGPYSLNLTHNYQNSGIHPRPKLQIGQRLARGYLAVEAGRVAPLAKLAGCRLMGSGGSDPFSLTLTFDATLLGAESVAVQRIVPGGLLPLQVRVGGATNVSSGWVYALGLTAINATSVTVFLPLVEAPPNAVRYAWADSPCCPLLNASTGFCPPEACPIVTSENTAEPAVPFYALIVGGKCVCEAPWDCGA